ncbi:MAG: zonular occludens toxin [Pseudomonas sp.]|nr:zonular occludens toxin [Pseudomonas sp.]
MFVLRTGLQGNGKTLNTIKEVDEKAAREKRTVYYHNLTGLKPEHPMLKATWIEFEDPYKWYELPDNAIIVIDEAQKFFRVRPQGSAVPEYASALETMRKQGHELHCITQNPKLIDAHFRNLCNSHIHYQRGHQGKIIKRWRFETPVDVDKNKTGLERFGEATRVVLDKRYFGVYQSVNEEAGHHFKFRPPRALWVFLICCALIVAGGVYLYKKRIAPTPEPAAVASAPATSATAASAVPVASAPPPERKLSYLEERIPRIPDVPSSAPVYDHLTKPVTYPRPSCLYSSNAEFVRRNAARFELGYVGRRLHGCRCNSQQGSRLVISFEACMEIVKHGYFDPARPDRMQQQPPGTEAPQNAQNSVAVAVGAGQ